ncbi:hypothetical protein ACN4EK_05065 [Pantanalinema rosaneae CENA516]|uniref:hypothetical protein n=1 Tax=Pantanalinema rosaneae TaxID=1620701 RepID=UPI003D6FE3F4
MSEAANSPFDPDLSASSASVSPPEISSPALTSEPTAIAAAESIESVEDDWQTVDLPGAISVDALLAGEVNLVEMAATPAPSVPVPASDAIAQLHQENATLREQIQQLEQDLTQAQIELQLEIARSLYTQSASVTIATAASPSPAEPPDATNTVPAIEQLTQELELAQQAAQRQQILVETLTNQLNSSQERVAQLERECALTQQRYNEQMQQLLQSENTCRDLRMRLMRQQQHTLQFKAALEKCLDMPAALQQHPFVQNFELDDQATSNPDLEGHQVGHAPFVPKAHPVKPWSTEADSTEGFYTTAGFDLSGLPNLLSKLRPSDDWEDGSEQGSHSYTQIGDPVQPLTEAEVASEPLAADAPEQIGELLNLMFPDSTEVPIEPIAAAPTPDPIFDLSPFMEAGAVVTPAIEQPPTEAAPLAATPQTSAGNMWDDLAQLIDPATPDPSGSSTHPDRPLPTPEPDLLAAATLNSASADDHTDLELPTPPVQRQSSRPILLAFPATSMTASVTPSPEPPSVPESVAAHSSATWTAYAIEEASQLDTDAAPANFEDPNAVPANWPSPVLYPLRPTKRLKSLAAVELPTFRRG